MMRRIAAVFLLLVTTAGAAAGSASIGVGVFGGESIPIVQEDAAKGSQFGVRLPVALNGFFSVEPYYASSSLGEAKETFNGHEYTREGFDVKSYGVNAALGRLVDGPKFAFYPFAGIGSNKLTRTGSDDIKETGYDFGLGIGLGLASRFTLHIRGQVNMVKTGDTSRKFADATAGLQYALTRAH